MKVSHLFPLSLAILAMSIVPAFATGPITVVKAGYHTGYIPSGFDSNDRVQIVGEGIFPNTCYRPATPRVEVDEVTREVKIAPQAYQYDGICLQMLVPFDQTLNLGILAAGTYRVIQENGGGDLGNLRVGVATSSDADDFLYAPISQAYTETHGGKTSVRVTGSFTDSCMRLVDVTVSVEPKVLVVLPIAEREARADCTAGNFPFDRSVEIGAVRSGRYLLHVRSLNGNAFNHLVDL